MPEATFTATWARQPDRPGQTTPASLQGANTNRVTWGVPSSPGGDLNAYRFEGGTVEVPLDGSEFVLGTFTHENRPTSGTSSFSLLLNTVMTLADGSRQNFKHCLRHQEKPDPEEPADHTITYNEYGNDITLEGVVYWPIITRFVPEGQELSTVPVRVPRVVGPEGRETRARVMAVMCRSRVAATARIAAVQYKGQVATTQADEYVEILNPTANDLSLAGWKVGAGDTGQAFTFPDFDLGLGQRCRVYTNEVHPEWGGFSFGLGRSIWNDKGDIAELRSPDGTLVSSYAYGDHVGLPTVDPLDHVPISRIPAITVIRGGSGWVYTALFGSQYVEFNDSRILRTGSIGGTSSQEPGRWTDVLPPLFWRDLSGAGAIQDPATLTGASTPHTYMFRRGDNVAFFHEDKLIEETTVTGKWPALSSWLGGATLQELAPVLSARPPVRYLALSMDRYSFSNDTGVLESGRIGTKWPFLPQYLHSDIDCAAVIPESRWKFLFIQIDTVTYFTDVGITEGPRKIADKWPHLWEWMQQGGK